jgi:endonuclease YncB( thermonuclease family)
MLADAVASLIVGLIVLLLIDRFPQVDFLSNVTVTDGDSLRRGSQRIRLYGIDAPELTQTCRDRSGDIYQCGEEARRFLRDLIGRREISCNVIQKDRYERDLARCRVGDMEINREMVQRGWAIAYRRDSIDYVLAEAVARRAKRGLWQGEFDWPEDFRAQQRERVKRGEMIVPDWLEAD